MLLNVQIPKIKVSIYISSTIADNKKKIYIIWDAKINYSVLQNIVEQKWSMRVGHFWIIKSNLS